MGENVLRNQVKSFQKGADRSLEKMSAPTLFDRPEIISVSYTAIPLDGCKVAVDDQLDAHAAADGKSILLAKGHTSMARIDGDGAVSLLDALRCPGSPGVVRMSVTNLSSISGCMNLVVTPTGTADVA